jgi:hypothetical protein
LDDVSEVIFQQKISNPGNGSAPKTATGTIVIPGSAVAGSAKMRVSVKRDGFPTPCETIPFGEVEDYRVTIPTSFANNSTDNRNDEIAASVSNDFEIYPNPNDGLATLRVTDFIGKQVTIAVFNQNGQKIKELRFDQLDIPWVEIDLGDVPSGQFFIQLNAAGMRSVSKKMMVSKKF